MQDPPWHGTTHPSQSSAGTNNDTVGGVDPYEAINDVLWDGGAVGFFPEPNGPNDDDPLGLGAGITRSVFGKV